MQSFSKKSAENVPGNKGLKTKPNCVRIGITKIHGGEKGWHTRSVMIASPAALVQQSVPLARLAKATAST